MSTKARSTAAPLSEDAIRHRAYLMWEADGRPDGMADHYWMKASEPPPDVGARPKVKATAAKTAAALKSAKSKGKAVNPAEATPAKAKSSAKADKPKHKAAAAKVSAPAVKAKPAAKAPAKKAAKKA